MMNWEKIGSNVVSLDSLGTWGAGRGDTFKISDSLFEKEFNLEQPFVSGLYCFYYIGSQTSLKSHIQPYYWVKGKQYSERYDEKRLKPEVQRLTYSCQLRKPKKNPPYVAAVPFIEHFSNLRDLLESQEDSNITPLYVGKSSNIIRRLNEHLYWSDKLKNEFIQSIQTNPQVVIKPNPVCQFRVGFEAAFVKKNDSERRSLLRNQIGVGIIENPFVKVSERFFSECEAISHLRPPFNVDSER